ncbi:hypothetical protein [Butyrivibrio sp.]|uniref:hypothetical protein n=1 Tax=Butyrivibrio sp. TaxID=28121 RepID=UPI0025BD9528|nr:hypothetical protein [Butyrivibrio sp.]MBQ7430251.1 hypothetical protein [Butyrivibrio sp.]MBQ9303425.1 hypothetical protein [Butyrivibrio sp.]
MHSIPEFNIAYEDHETRTNLPGMILQKLEPWLQFHNVEYRLVKGDDIPDDWIQGYTFRGRSFVRHTVVVVSKLNSEQLHAVAEELFHCDEEEIKNLRK